MADYYFEFTDDAVKHYGLKGRYLHVRDIVLQFQEKFIATRIWREASDGSVYWVKNRNAGLGRGLRLDNTELNEFVWVKLSAHNT